jgi:hypothetical protein
LEGVNALPLRLSINEIDTDGAEADLDLVNVHFSPRETAGNRGVRAPSNLSSNLHQGRHPIA